MKRVFLRLAVPAAIALSAAAGCSNPSGPGTNDGGPPDRTNPDICTGTEASVRLLWPGALTTVSSRRPKLRWTGGNKPRSVDLCRERACTSIIQAIDAGCDSVAQPQADLPTGRVFWRVRTENASSATWSFQVRNRSAPVDTAWGLGNDFNGDGFADLAVGAPAASPGAENGRIYIFAGGPSGIQTTASRALELAAWEYGKYLVAAGDINGDGYADLLANEFRLGKPLHLGGPDGLTTTFTQMAAPVSASLFLAAAGVGDIDADGFGDFLMKTGTNYTVYRGSATGLHPDATGTLAGVNSIWPAGDVNGDGQTDVGASGSSNTAQLLWANLSKSTRLTSATSTSEFGQYIAGGDFNGDGYADLFVKMNSIYLGQASLPTNMGESANLTSMSLDSAMPGDLNGDGFDDVLIGGSIWYGAATGLGNPVTTSAFGQPQAVGDLNGDGKMDVVVLGGSEVAVFYGATSGLTAGPVLTNPFTDTRSFGSSVAAP